MIELQDNAFDIIAEAHEANPYHVDSILNACEIMIDRREKYSGEFHAYWSFADMARRTGGTLDSVFDFYINIKLSRGAVGKKDFEDGSFTETLRDHINYAALWRGARIHNLTVEDILGEEDEEDIPHKTILLDFDGVLNQFKGWTGVYEHYEPVEGAKKFLEALKAEGYYVIIFTARPSDDLPSVAIWLQEHGMWDYVAKVTNVKIPAKVYIDDRAVRFDGDYMDIMDKIKDFAPHWQVKLDKTILSEEDEQLSVAEIGIQFSILRSLQDYLPVPQHSTLFLGLLALEYTLDEKDERIAELEKERIYVKAVLKSMRDVAWNPEGNIGHMNYKQRLHVTGQQAENALINLKINTMDLDEKLEDDDDG